jgi:hypothetical protein
MICRINTNISVSPGLIDLAIGYFKSGVKQIASEIVIQLIFVIDEQNNEIKNFYTELEMEPSSLETLDYDELHNFMDKNAIKIKRLLNILEPFKNKSESFMQLNTSLDRLYETLVITPIEIGFLETKQMQNMRLLDAS